MFFCMKNAKIFARFAREARDLLYTYYINIYSAQRRRKIFSQTVCDSLKLILYSFQAAFCGAKYTSTSSPTSPAAKKIQIYEKFQLSWENLEIFHFAFILAKMRRPIAKVIVRVNCTIILKHGHFAGSLIIPDRNAPEGWRTELDNRARAGGRPLQ